MLSQVSNMTEAEKTRLHVADKNMDYAGKEFYETSNYINSVVIEVTKEMITQAGTDGACIALGLYIGNPNDPTETPDANEWTVFDEFRVLYASNVKGKELVLDELRGDLSYLKEGVTYKNSILHLAKTFTMNRWNSFVLPVDLTANQVRTAFGNDVRLAKLKTLTETELQFETVNLDEHTNIALEAYQPYIIFPTKTMEKYSPYTATISETNKVVIQGEHFKIPNVTFKMTADGKNDLSAPSTRMLHRTRPRVLGPSPATRERSARATTSSLEATSSTRATSISLTRRSAVSAASPAGSSPRTTRSSQSISTAWSRKQR